VTICHVYRFVGETRDWNRFEIVGSSVFDGRNLVRREPSLQFPQTQQTVMAESSSLWTTKQRIRHLDLPIKNFVENAIPYQVDALKTLKLNMAKQRRLEDRSGMRQLQMKAAQSIKRARALLREMDTLRNQVADIDLQTFDDLMNPSRYMILDAIDMFKNEDLDEKKKQLLYLKEVIKKIVNN